MPVPRVPTMAELVSRLAAVSEAEGIPLSRTVTALQRQEKVEELSRDGKKVSDIAQQLGISTRHVVELRAAANIGRRRGR